jgi:RNA polymerase sigma-70 factor (ECF subfamily)
MGRGSVDPAHDHELSALLSLAQQGDGPAYARFLQGACRALRPFLARRLREPDLAEDVLQDTLLAIHRARHTHLPGRPVGPWLYVICEHRIADFHRQRRRTARVEARDVDHLIAGGDPGPTERQAGALAVLARLPGKQRRVIELLKLRDLSVREVALQIGMSESAVKVTAFRGYRAMRKMMGVNRK